MNDLQQAIESILERIDFQNLKKASAILSERYRSGETLRGKEELAAYLIVRLPATYAAIQKVLAQLPSFGSLLDLGAGPGTAYWAARSAWDQQPDITALEKENTFIELGKLLGSQVTWKQGDMLNESPFDPHDWILFGYSLGEIAEASLKCLLTRCWQACRKGVIIVEPGTPRGYHRMLQARTLLIEQGGSVFAPCPHSHACPLSPSDWCHFSVRVERSFWHRFAKEAPLPYEDEKFSYVILTKENLNPAHSRLIRPPLHRSGHTLLPLCTPTGLQTRTLSRSQKELYKKARKATWGDSFCN